jgi:excinuclease ABC subunit C
MRAAGDNRMNVTREITEDRIRQLLRSLPDRPGVYIFRDRKARVLYVGKAISLRKRVMSYFHKGARTDASLRTNGMVSRIHDFDFVTTANETEALLLEANFIKHHRPPYNVMLRDDKSYPYVAITVNEEFPRVFLTRKPHKHGVAYFGPFVSAGRLRDILDLMGKIFPFRKCQGRQPGRRTGSPCLNYHIGLCLAPCAGKVDKVTYRQMIHKLERLLSGKPEGLLQELEESMQAAASAQRYEEAAFIRNRLLALEHLLEKQSAMSIGVESMDVMGIYIEGDSANVQVLQVRDGNLVNRRSFFLKNVAGEEEQDIIEQFVIQYYSSPIGLPHEVILPAAMTDTATLQTFLTGEKGSSVEAHVGLRGKRRRLSEMASRNAVLAFKQDQLREKDTHERSVRGMAELKKHLSLKQEPRRIECYDISNIGGEDAVGSMVVLENGEPRPDHYRRFSIKTVAGQNDFAMMAEVLSRRFSRKEEPQPAGEAADVSFSSRPDLIVVDGGAGQVSAAVAALDLLHIEDLPVIGLAKKYEEIYIFGRPKPLVLPPDSDALTLLQRIRDEAHRFAVTYHRLKRGKKVSSSILDGIPGIGPSRKKAILAHFGSPDRFLEASSEELEAVPGLPAKIARNAFTFVHKLG